MKQIIWSTELYLDDEARAEFEQSQREVLEWDEYEVSDHEWMAVVDGLLSDQRLNLNEPVNGIIIAFADLGLWQGRRQGYKILGHRVKDIFSVCEDENEWYGDGSDIRGSLTHHDGTHHVLYRIAKDRDHADELAEQIYNGIIGEEEFISATKSLFPYVAGIYGWPSKPMAV